MKLRLHWGVGITLVYGLFASGTLGVAIFASRAQVDLVSPDYYTQSLDYDRHRAAVERGAGVDVRVSIDDARTMTIAWPPASIARAAGTITLYRASSAGADRTVAIAADAAGRQAVSLDGIAAGHWQARLEWTRGADAFYVERDLIVR